MPYSHYGNIGDIWKHLPLCEFLKYEHPKEYIETNSASPMYHINPDPKKKYGIFTYMEKVNRSEVFKNAVYTKLIQKANKSTSTLQTYLGSPGLAMTYLGAQVERYIFFDIEKEPLEEISNFAQKKGLTNHVDIYQQDSIIGSYNLLPQLSKDTFIHFDPYYAFEKGADELSFFDVFCEASTRGLKSMLWYCFFTLDEREEMHSTIKCGIKEHGLNHGEFGMKGSEILLKIIEQESIPVNPGILGCGILICNLSKKSNQLMELYSKNLVNLYQGTTVFDDYPGDLISEQLIC